MREKRYKPQLLYSKRTNSTGFSVGKETTSVQNGIQVNRNDFSPFPTKQELQGSWFKIGTRKYIFTWFVIVKLITRQFWMPKV